MDADRSREQMTDSAVDREIQAMLAVDPSPDFAARVRTRIASEPQPTASWLSWKRAAVAGIAAVVVLAAVVARWREGTTVTLAPTVTPTPVVGALRPAEAARPTEPPAVPMAQAATSPAASAPKVVQAFRPAAVAANRAAQIEPEILIDARESSALRALMLGAREGRIDLEPVLRASAPTAMDLPPLGAIDIPFLTIDPITPGSGDEGVWQ